MENRGAFPLFLEYNLNKWSRWGPCKPRVSVTVCQETHKLENNRTWLFRTDWIPFFWQKAVFWIYIFKSGRNFANN